MTEQENPGYFRVAAQNPDLRRYLLRNGGLDVNKIVLGLLILIIGTTSSLARQLAKFTTLSNLIEQAQYIVIAAVERRSPELYHDGWVKYECRFLYWLKAPAIGGERALQMVPFKTATTNPPIPLWTLDDGQENLCPGPAPTNAVLLVDTHEKVYNRLVPGEDTRNRNHVRRKDLEVYNRLVPGEDTRRVPESVMQLEFRNTYHLLFLTRGSSEHPARSSVILIPPDSHDPYREVGCYQSILPVSPNLDIRKLPPEPHRQRADQPPVEMTSEEAIRFIVADYIKFKEEELGAVKQDLNAVRKNPEMKAR